MARKFAGFPSGGNKGGGGNMMKQAQKMQEEMLRVQQTLQEKEYTGSAGGGAVTASVNGAHEVLRIVLNPEVVDPEEIDMLQDLIVVAVNEAMKQAEADSSDQMSKLTGGLNLPGLF